MERLTIILDFIQPLFSRSAVLNDYGEQYISSKGIIRKSVFLLWPLSNHLPSWAPNQLIVVQDCGKGGKEESKLNKFHVGIER